MDCCTFCASTLVVSASLAMLPSWIILSCVFPSASPREETVAATFLGYDFGQTGNFGRGVPGVLRQLAHLVRHHSDAALLPGARRFNRGIQGKQVCLA